MLEADANSNILFNKMVDFAACFKMCHVKTKSTQQAEIWDKSVL